jgi:hypothetical protein
MPHLDTSIATGETDKIRIPVGSYHVNGFEGQSRGFVKEKMDNGCTE